MGRVEATKALITMFNITILFALPVFGIWHAIRIRYFKYWSHEWWTQIIITLCYIAAMNAEIPAFLSRLIAYYIQDLKVSGVLYTLNTWDRWAHVLFYGLFVLLTWIFTKNRMPKYIIDTLGGEPDNV